MQHSSIRISIIGFLLAAIPMPVQAQPLLTAENSRSIEAGIASRYPGDVGIADDPQVVFAENFEGDLDQLSQRWESIKARESMSGSPDVPVASRGEQSLLISHVGGEGDGGYLYQRLNQGYDKLHYRFYVKFDQDCQPIHHFFHVGGYQPSTAWPQGGAGSRPVGNERLSTGVEPFGEMWRWDCYSYWMEMQGSPPRGQCWGNSFVHDPQARVTRGEWQCLELMMQLNQPGERDGEMALWLDGKLLGHFRPGSPQGKWIFDKFLPGEGGEGARWSDAERRAVPLQFGEEGDAFEGFRWRSTEELQLNFVWLLCYITKAEPGAVSRIRFDDIVIAKEYIGPITE